MKTTISVIVVLYNEFKIVQQCLSSIYRQNISNMEVLLVDNSDKAGVNVVLKKFPHLTYIKNKTNLGFGKAVNVGLLKAKGEFALILTPDTKLLPNTITKTLEFIKTNRRVALVGCKVYSYPNNFHVSACKEFPNLISHLFEYNILFYKICQLINSKYHPLFYSANQHKQILFPKHIIGAYMLLRMSAIEPLKFFDNSFKMYREETDLCKRLIQNNWQIAYLPEGGLIHFGGGEWKKTTISQALPNYMASTYTFFNKHYGKAYTVLAWILGLVSAIISIPYLYIVSTSKTILGKKSQSTQLLPDYIKILTWHIINSFWVLSL
ncbi:MAG TPA: glycosyltransferase family 2 protein [Patescibacteria group bacterium]